MCQLMRSTGSLSELIRVHVQTLGATSLPTKAARGSHLNNHEQQGGDAATPPAVK